MFILGTWYVYLRVLRLHTSEVCCKHTCQSRCKNECKHARCGQSVVVVPCGFPFLFLVFCHAFQFTNCFLIRKWKIIAEKADSDWRSIARIGWATNRQGGTPSGGVQTWRENRWNRCSSEQRKQNHRRSDSGTAKVATNTGLRSEGLEDACGCAARAQFESTGSRGTFKG